MGHTISLLAQPEAMGAHDNARKTLFQDDPQLLRRIVSQDPNDRAVAMETIERRAAAYVAETKRIDEYYHVPPPSDAENRFVGTLKR